MTAPLALITGGQQGIGLGIARTLAAAGWEKLLNRQGTTWRKLDAAVQASVVDARTAAAVMVAAPSVIKRPVVMWADRSITVGFKPESFELQLA